MTQRHRECIGGIGREFDLQQQQRAYHVCDLRLGRRAVSSHGHLDGSGGVFVHAGAERRRSAQGHAPSLAKLQRAVGVAMHEHALDGDAVGPMFGHQRADRGIDALQPHHHVVPDHVDAAAGHVTLTAAATIDDSIAGALRAWIQTEHATVARDQSDRRRCH